MRGNGATSHGSCGLNTLEAETYIWTELNLTGDSIFRKGLNQLLAWRYKTNTVRQKVTFPPESVVEWDDELAFHCLHPLLTYCDDPRLRSIYLGALTKHWEVMRMQKVNVPPNSIPSPERQKTFLFVSPGN